jgi:hypothetical protein
MRPTTLMLSGESTGTGFPSGVRHSGIRVDKLAEHGAQRVDGVAARDGQHVGAVGADTLPDAAGAPLQHGRRYAAQVGGEDFTDVALADEVARVENGRGAARLQTDDALERALTGEPGHLFRLAQGPAQRPLAEHGLSGL